MKLGGQEFWNYPYLMEYTNLSMKRLIVFVFSLAILGTAMQPLTAQEENHLYSPWSFFGGLNYIYNSDGDGVSDVPGGQSDGSPGGLESAPSQLVGVLGLEYRLPIWKPGVYFSPSVSLLLLSYLWANDQALPAEIENRTAFVPAILLDGSFLYTIEKDRFLYSFGGGPGIMIRYGFLESGVSENERTSASAPTAGEQVENINSYLWSSLRWFYPMIQGGVRYRLTNGWGAGVNLRIGIPVFNLWSEPDVSFADSLMILFALTITPPSGKKVYPPDSLETPQESLFPDDRP